MPNLGSSVLRKPNLRVAPNTSVLFLLASGSYTVYEPMQSKRGQLCPTCAALERESSQVMRSWLALEHSIGDVRRKEDAFTAAHQAFERLIEQRSRCKKCREIKA